MLLQQKSFQLLNSGFNWCEIKQSESLSNARIAAFIALRCLNDAQSLLGEPSEDESLERVRLRARCCQWLDAYQDALSLLEAAVVRAPRNLPLRIHLCDLVFEARDSKHAYPVLHAALNDFGEHPALLPYVCRAKLLCREPSLAARAKLMERCWLSLEQRNTHQDGNLLNAYENLGHPDWLVHLPRSRQESKLTSLDLQVNLVMQLASAEAANYADQVVSLVNTFTGYAQFEGHRSSAPAVLGPEALPADHESSLEVMWVTGDVTNHPVCRFLLGFFQASLNRRRHRHTVMATQPPSPEFRAFIEQQAQVALVDISQAQAEAKTAALRARRAHIAVDLSGWTAGNHVTGFMARVAPIQVNYLGYFASAGIPAVDFWLGDAALFPRPMREWHSETIWRLPRCFLAWQPPSYLVEAGVPVTPPPRAAGIRFGCFNHFRKVSDACLEAWGRILALCPEARLVLKGTTSFDTGSVELTRRRLLRQGLDPDRIDWLPLTPTPREHLEQYAHMDVALDCFPNTGCTTTCEALWMGVPVVSLRGRGYVSRMGAAVLAGAGLDELIAADVDAYVALAVSQADQLEHLRAQRATWRHRLQASPLGDAAGLFEALEQAFSAMAQQVRRGAG
jgi:predicted O-linked N-acetylglucosamine transferase (SPINDLY family)